MYIHKWCWSIAAIIAMLSTQAAEAVTLPIGPVTPTGASASTYYRTSPADSWKAVHLIDNSGLDIAGSVSSHHAAIYGDNSWATASTGDNTDYFAVSSKRPTLVFTLDQMYSLDEMVVWNYAGEGNAAKNGVSSVTVDFSQDGGGTFSNAVALTLSMGTANGPSQTLNFGQHYATNAIRLTITDNFFDGTGGGDRVGLSEVKFLAPEPSSVLSAIIGLAGWSLFGFLHRWRKRNGRIPQGN